MQSYESFFEKATGHSPYPYQQRLANGAPALLEIPTGLGKTEATVLAWLYRRIQSAESTPRRLFYCLPMRSLVEQTRARIERCFAKLELHDEAPGIETVMGGDVGEAWYRTPERPFVVIGTQDMLLSRALNRGYAMSRFQWPMTFGAANDDAYWVIDEVQLQGIGAVTAAQLQAFRERLGTFHRTELTLASATIDASWFETADFSVNGRVRIALDGDDLSDPAIQRIASAEKRIERASAFDPKDVAAFASGRHRAGTRTLVVVNRVARAQEIYRQLKRLCAGVELVLLHSRFRPQDRAAHAAALLADVDRSSAGRIVVATQVVEAGIDVSAATLITDVAPWSSLVQRFGRCNRRGEDSEAACIWLDGGEPKKNDARPYELDDLVAARELLTQLEGKSGAPADLPTLPIPLRDGLVLRKPEFLDLFDTSPDLSGHDVDVSPYIRPGDDVSVCVFWRDDPPGLDDAPQSEELCSAPLGTVRDLVKTLRADHRSNDSRIANQFARFSDDKNWSPWIPLHEQDLRPGSIVWLNTNVGWYTAELGFEKAKGHVPPISREPMSEPSENCSATDSDMLSQLGVAVTLTQHARDTFRQALALIESTGIGDPFAATVANAALWHDTGKAHEVFQDTMRRGNAGLTNGTAVWAKSIRRAAHRRPGFRHELPGALAYLHAHAGDPDADTVAYLIAAHHGKLRVAALQLPYEAAGEPFRLLGVVDGETLPSADLGEGVVSPPCVLSLAPFRVGTADGEYTWIDRTAALRDRKELGPFRLAYLELLVRLADWRASAEEKKQ